MIEKKNETPLGADAAAVDTARSAEAVPQRPHAEPIDPARECREGFHRNIGGRCACGAAMFGVASGTFDIRAVADDAA